ncbi:MAG TPA: caspase family protein [Thermoanaerobaculia bacterium]
MKTWLSLLLAIVLLAISITTAVLVLTRPEERSEGRSVQRAKSRETVLVEPWRPASTGLFVGVHRFPHDENLNVPFAADDAVDLAHKFSLDQRSSLVPPGRVILALSGEPRKEESKQRLKELREEGAEVEHATAGDILELLKRQTARAGANGLVVFSLATHGFLDDRGDAYILGSTSDIGSPETSLRLATLLDTAGTATRSLVFIDACRDRRNSSRSVGRDRTIAAPLIEKMARVQGQVIFYAAAADQVAYDDEDRQNGVFTGAVLDGLDCKASAPRGQVIAETLHTYVEREVRRWIEASNKPGGSPATQVSMEGSARNMPLAQCWRSEKFPIRVVVDGATVSAYDLDTNPLWRKTFAQPVVHAVPADLDADAFYEVVVGTGDTLRAYDRDGKELWAHPGDGMSLASFATGDLFRKHTTQIVALWNGKHRSRVTVVDSAGNVRSSDDYAARLFNVAVLRPTNMHNAIIAVTGSDRVCGIDAKKLSPRWCQLLRSPADTIHELRILDRDTRWRDLAVSTKNGMTLFDFRGKILSRKADWVEVR